MLRIYSRCRVLASWSSVWGSISRTQSAAVTLVSSLSELSGQVANTMTAISGRRHHRVLSQGIALLPSIYFLFLLMVHASMTVHVTHTSAIALCPYISHCLQMNLDYNSLCILLCLKWFQQSSEFAKQYIL